MNTTEEQGILMSCEILGTTHFVIAKFPSEQFVINHIFAITFNGIMIIPTILLNGVAVVTILRSSQVSSKSCYFIIFLQSVFDFAVGVLGIPLFIFFLANPVAEISNCFAMSFARILMFAPILGSSIALIAMTFERYIAILHPFAYKTLVTKKRLMKYVGANTMLEFLVIFGSFTAKRLFHLYVMVKVTLILLLTAYAYTRIYMVVKKFARKSLLAKETT